jgi:5-methylcytosine-specific restriction enzyme B
VHRGLDGHEEARDDVLAAANDLLPAFDRLTELATGTAVDAKETDVELAEKVRRFVNERHYPNEKDEWHKAERTAMADLLEPDQLPISDTPSKTG